VKNVNTIDFARLSKSHMEMSDPRRRVLGCSASRADDTT
jgi:hypothetical protein